MDEKWFLIWLAVMSFGIVGLIIVARLLGVE